MKKKFNKRMLLLNIPLCPKVNASAVITITPTLVDWPHTTAINTKRSSTTSVESAAMFLIHQRIFNSIGRGGIRTHEASVAAVEDDVMDIDDEAVMLEAAMFGGIPEGSGYRLPFAPHHLMQNGLNRGMDPYAQRMPRPPSPSLTAKGLLREQQDDEYFASLQTGRENELKAKEEAEAALAERRKEEQLRKKLEEQEIDRQLVAKEASLPQEPTSDDENAITLLVRMPDGSRGGRRFLKSDRLQYLFDFIDIGKGVKPGMYRLVRPYPRRAFSDGESALTLNELGLTSKQEALFLELI